MNVQEKSCRWFTCHAGCFGFSSRGNLIFLSDNTTCHRMCMRISVVEASAIKNIY